MGWASYINEKSIKKGIEVLNNPGENGLACPPLKAIFQYSSQPAKKEELYQKYISITHLDIEPLLFYLILAELYEEGRCKDGHMGFKIKIRPHFISGQYHLF